MLKKIKKEKPEEITGLASQCEAIEQIVHNSISEILKLVDSINDEIEEELINEDSSLEVESEKQVKAS